MKRLVEKMQKKRILSILFSLTLILIIFSQVFNGSISKRKEVIVAEKTNAKTSLTYIEEESTEHIVKEPNYYDKDYWEWHTRTTTTDSAYNGNHIIIGDSIKFYGYGVTSYKDFLYKDYSYAGEKTFSFILDETKANYHTLDGAGFIFNAKKEDNKLSGYILLIKEKQICLYRIDNVNISAFETTSNTTIATYAGSPITSITKKVSDTHKLIIKTSPTNITVIDNDEEVLNTNLDYSKHVGESFGLISSYTQHACSKLTEIEFRKFELNLDNYKISVLKKDETGKALKDADFEVKNEAGKVVRKGTTGEDGIFNIIGLTEGIYTLEETKAPTGYILASKPYKFKVTKEGKAVDIDTGKEIIFNIINKPYQFEIKNYITSSKNGISGIKIQLFNEKGEPILGKDGKPIINVTDGNGKIIFSSILPGTYTYKQIEVPSGYKINSNINKVMINKDGTVTFVEGKDGINKDGIIYNEKIENNKIIISTYKSGTTTPIEGAVIGIFDSKGNSILDKDGKPVKLTTNSKGQVAFTIKPGTYNYKQLGTPSGYIINNNMYEFTVSEDGKITFKDDTKGIVYNNSKDTTSGDKTDSSSSDKTEDKTDGSSSDKTEDKTDGSSSNKTEDKTDGSSSDKTEDKTDGSSSNKTENKTNSFASDKTNNSSNNKLNNTTEGNKSIQTNKISSKNDIDIKSGQLPKTGASRKLIIVISIMLIVVIYYAIKYKKVN